MKDPLLTIFSTPKPFTNPHIRVIQNNALLSWVNLGPEVEVLLIGEEEGVSQAATRYGVRFFPQVKRNSLGTPLISSMFAVARQNSESSFLAIVNTDVMLLPDCLIALKIAAERFNKFVLAGQRWDLAVTNQFNYNSDFYDQLIQKIKQSGRRHPPMGSDYFIFPRGCYLDVLDFAIGRAGWDNWMMFKSRFEAWPLIDASDDITVIHQDHDYSHLANGQPHYRLPETQKNVALAGGDYSIFTLKDSSHRLSRGLIKPPGLNLKRIWREIEIMPLTKWHSPRLGQLFYYLFHPRKGYGFIRSKLRKIA
jgi:hypothetical protein